MLTYSRRAWLQILLSGRGSFVRGVPVRLLTFGLVAVGVTLVDAYVTQDIRMATGLHEMGGAVIALILTFRANTAYNRFWEARTLWGTLVNSARNLARLVTTQAAAPLAGRPFVLGIVVFAHAVRARLRDESAVADARRLLPDDAATAVSTAANPPLAAANLLSLQLAGLRASEAIEPLMAQRAESLIGDLVNCLGGCERIRNTPTPLGYVLLMERFVAVYVLSLPFALLGRAGWLTPLVTLAISYPVLMFDALAIELDDPFGHDPNDLSLTSICATLEQELCGEAPADGPRIDLTPADVSDLAD